MKRPSPIGNQQSHLAVFVVPGRIFPIFFAGAMGAAAIVPRPLAGESVAVGFGVICDVIRIFPARAAPNGGAGYEDTVRTAGACVSGMAGCALVASIEASCAVTVCDAIGGLLKLFTNGEGGARDVGADVSKAEDRSKDREYVGRGMESGGENAIEEGVVAMSSNLVAAPSEMYN